MAHFSDNDILYSMPSGQQQWMVRESFYYEPDLNIHNGPVRIWVHRGFPTDFASIPGVAKWLIDDDATEIKDPAVLHDWLYTKQPTWCSRKTADQLLKEAMKVRGAPLWERVLVFQAVRLGGWYCWWKNKQRNSS